MLRADELARLAALGTVVSTPAQRAEWKKYGIKSWEKFEEIIGKETMDTIRKNIQK